MVEFHLVIKHKYIDLLLLMILINHKQRILFSGTKSQLRIIFG